MTLAAENPATLPIPPKANDATLKIELIATVPEVEACTTVCGAPDGSIYVGNDPRDGRLNTKEPVCTIVRFGNVTQVFNLRSAENAGSKPAPRSRTIFADKLYSPAGSAWHDGWLYVVHDPLMSRFKDTDGDGVAEVREDLITNLGHVPYEGLNDHCVSGFTLGMDGFFYISVGDRGVYQAKSAKDGSTLTMQGGGIMRCRTDGTQLEIFSTGTRNHLSVNLDAEDNAFTRDNTDDGNGWWTRLTHHIEGGYYGYPYDYRKAPNYGVVQPSQQTLDALKQHGGMAGGPVSSSQSSVVRSAAADSPLTTDHFLLTTSPPFLPAIADFGGGSPTGGLCYLSDGLPEQYRGKHFFSEWGKGGLFVTGVARDGATFKLVSDTKLVEAGKGGEFRPMQISVAADGSLLIADWGYGGWKSPKIAGAVWRLYWPEAKPAPRLKDESKASIEELIAALGHPDRDQRLRAELELIQRGERIVPQLASLFGDPHDVGVVRGWHAIWTLENIMGAVLGTPRAEWWKIVNPIDRILDNAAASSDDSTRAQAMRALAGRRTRIDCENVAAMAERLHTSPDAAVRLQAALAMGRMGYDNLPALLLHLLDDSDSWVRFAARFALAREIEEYGLSAFDVETKDSAKPELSEEKWLTIESVRLAQGKFALPADLHPLTNARAVWGQEDVIPFLAERLSGKFNVTPKDRARAASVLGRFAYQPKPWDGRWWGTQPVKGLPPPKSAPWAGTAKALEALTTALSDPDAGVRLAAAKAFTSFVLDAGNDAAVGTALRAVRDGSPAATGVTSGASPDGSESRPYRASAAALTMLRARLTAESDPAIRRQLIESIGVQKDPQATDLFMQIALDEKADAEFRDTAIGAVVNIGGDTAKKTIARLADAKLSPAATRRIIQAAGALKVLEAAPALIAHLKGEDAGNREFAAKALGKIGPKSNATAGSPTDQPPLVPGAATSALIDALRDPDSKVQVAAVEALGSLRDKAALPALIALAEKNQLKNETITALAAMPDQSALPVLVEAVRDKNTAIRRNALKALKSMREQAWPLVEELLGSGRVPPELEPEIRNSFQSGVIAKWKMIGPFENVWGAVHPPEKDVLAAPAAGKAGGTPAPLLLARRYVNAEGKETGWMDVSADAEHGRVNLAQVFHTNAMVCAYAYAEVEALTPADAKVLCGSDDQIAIWINGEKVHDFADTRGFTPDTDEVPIRLVGGTNEILVKIGNTSGPWEFALRLPGSEDGRFRRSKDAPEEQHRRYALAVKSDGSWLHAGDPAKGEKLFFDPNAALGGLCATCHTVRGKGGQAGSDLSTIATNYRRPDLTTSILEPSKTIALGFENHVIETKSGETWMGIIRADTEDALTLVGADAQSHVIKKADVKSRQQMAQSLMPQGLTLALKPEAFTDLLAYLETLRGAQ